MRGSRSRIRVFGAGLVAVMVAMVMAAGPAGAQDGPTATVTPSTDLTDGETVTIEASGFGGELFQAAMCIPDGTGLCPLDFDTGGSLAGGADGEITADFEVTRVVSGVDCAFHPCNVWIGSLHTFEAVYVPVTFEADGPPPDPPTGTVALTAMTPHQLTVSISCTEATDVSLATSMSQTRAGIHAFTSHTTAVDASACDGTSFDVTVDHPPTGDRMIGKGRTDVSATLTVSGNGGQVVAEVTDRPKFEATPTVALVTADQPGSEVSVEILGLTGHRDDQEMQVRVACSAATIGLEVRGIVSQWVGRNLGSAESTAALAVCDGVVDISIPLTPRGKVKSGPAQGLVEVRMGDTDVIAGAQAPVEVDGRIKEQIVPLGFSSDALTIEAVTQRTVTLTYECDPAFAASVQITVRAEQYRGVTIRRPGATVWFECPTADPQTLVVDLQTARLRTADAYVRVTMLQYDGVSELRTDVESGTWTAVAD